MSTFIAKYPGTCQDCGDAIEPGDEIIYAGGKAVHGNGECSLQEVARASPQVGIVCTECWTEKSVTGACACDPE